MIKGRLRKIHLIYAITALWFSVVLFWPRSSNNNRDQEEGSQNLAQEDLYRANLTQANFGLLGVRFYESVEGQPRWKIESQFAELHRKENYAFLKGVTANFFSEATQNKILTKSDYGRSWSEKNYVELDGNVSIESGQGYLFWMNHLNYDGKKHEFSSNDTVQMKGPNINRPIMFLKGTGLNAQINKEHFILNQNVSSKKKLENGQWLKIFAKAGEFFTNESRAVFIGGVKSMMPDIKITSDIFELSSEEGQENVQAFGNVILKNKDRIGYAQKAYLEIGGSEIILEGKARIEADGNVIEGKRIKLYSDDDKIEVEEAEGRTANETSR
jgi:LPS export ABC transporter protein LptC/lipopolysaccharide transport protein LptA